ncbi:MAG: alpha/beta fold hydrolase [Anaerolineae bacterium]|nr:alpha/beta fold hydrolase [Anaerolineae bacterium]
MPGVSLAGETLFYARHGIGPAVVLIHGAGGSHLTWPPALRALEGVAVYAIDLPGHGRSAGAGRQRVADYAADVVAFLNAVGVERAVLVGHSMGGAIAQTVALDAPERVAGLVLLGTGARLKVSDVLLERVTHDVEGAVRLIAEWAWGPGTGPDVVARGVEVMMETRPEVLLGDFVACNLFDVRERVAGIGAPALVLAGSEDKMAPAKFGQSLAQAIPDARFEVLPGAGHMLALERPAEVAQRIAAFLKAVK